MNVLDPELNTKAKRMSTVIRVSHVGFSIARRNIPEETYIHW
jgi:hypothetical protein